MNAGCHHTENDLFEYNVALTLYSLRSSFIRIECNTVAFQWQLQMKPITTNIRTGAIHLF